MGSREHLTICAYVVFVLCMCVFSPGGLCQMNVCKSIVAFCQLFINCIFVSQQEISVGLRWLGSTKLYHTSSWGGTDSGLEIQVIPCFIKCVLFPG